MIGLREINTHAFPVGRDERFYFEAEGINPAELTPGRFARALYAATGASGDSVSWFAEGQRGLFELVLAGDAARRVITPLTIPMPGIGAQRPAVVTLRRDTDPITLDPSAFELSWTDDGPAPTPGSVAVALHALDKARLFSDDILLAMPAGATLRLTLTAAAIALGARTDLVVAGRPMVLARIPR